MSVYDTHPSEHYLEIFIEDYLLAVEGEFFYTMNKVIARIASPEPIARTLSASAAPLAAPGEAVGAWGSYPLDMKKP